MVSWTWRIGWPRNRMSKYFQPYEIEGLNVKLVEMLDIAREAAGIPFVITSGYRTPEQNAQAGGVSDSSHLKGLAVDIRAPSNQIGKIVSYGLGMAGFKRFIAYSSHIHVDVDDSKLPCVYDGGESK